MNLIEELKRRNVFKVALVYIIAGWLVMQVVDVMFPALNLPEWTVTLIAALLIIGFPFAMIFSWVYELTPEGLKLEKEIDRSAALTGIPDRKLNYLIAVLLVVVIGVMLANRFWPAEEVVQEAGPAASGVPEPALVESARPVATDGVTSVAVLPFVNMSPDPENEFFSDGISEELLNVLVKVEGLRVPSRTSSFAFRDNKDMEIQDIGRELEVDHILEGSVRKAGNRVRITAQLIDVGTDSHLWSDAYDRELEDIFAIQDEIANAIVDALKTTLGTEDLPPPQESRLTDNLEAYELYLQGRYLVRQRGYANLIRAQELLLRALDLDPGFSQAWSTLSAVYLLQPAYVRDENLRDLSMFNRAREASKQALALNPSLAEAQAVLAALYRTNSGERHLALAAHEKSVQLDPKDSTAQLWYGIALFEHGYLQEALDVISRAQSLDPTSPVHNDWLTRIHGAVGDRVAMEKAAERTRALGRSFQEFYRALYALMDGDPDAYEAISFAAFELAPQGYLGGDYREMTRAVTAAKKNPALREQTIASLRNYEGYRLVAYEGLRASGPFFEHLADLVKRGNSSSLSVLWSPWNDFVRQDPAFAEFAETIGLVEVWEQRGWPDLCHPVGDSFECD